LCDEKIQQTNGFGGLVEYNLRAGKRELEGISTTPEKTVMKMTILKKTSAAGIIVLILSIFGAWQTATAATEAWIGTWATGEQLVESQNNPALPYLANNTLRQVVHATLGGSRIRVHFSNKYTTSGGSITINSAHIALCGSYPVNGSIITSTDTPLTFNSGSSSVTIAAEAEQYSDAVDFNVPPLSNLSVSIYFGTASSTNVTGHPGSRTTYYLQSGNHVTDADMSSAAKTAHWYVISRIEVLLDDSYGCVVALGDSITDGRTNSGNDNTNYRWPDVLAARIQADPSTAKIGVINQGIGGNCIISGGLGPTASSRFDHDVTGQPGIRWAIILEGVNDIAGGQSAGNITSAYQTFVTKAHNAGILIYGATITPFKGNGYYSAAHETVRQTVNTWIRTPGHFDGVIDFDAAVRDPADAEQINPIYQFEWLHFNPAGYAAMGNTVDLYLFKNSANLDETGSVDFFDFAYLASQWRQAPGDPNADIAPQWGDGIVDLNDLHLMTCEWLKDN
jgi:lysophospholipase L1-like esterase